MSSKPYTHGEHALLAKCFDYLNREISRRPLNETAANGTQALSLEIAQFLDSEPGSEHAALSERVARLESALRTIESDATFSDEDTVESLKKRMDALSDYATAALNEREAS